MRECNAMRCRQVGHSQGNGFTLVEMLIALALLSLLMLALTSAMGGIGAAERRVDARLEEAENTTIVEHLLRQLLGTASARTVVAVNAAPNRAPAPWYEGEPNRLTWVGVMPGGYGGGGRHFFQLAVEPNAEGAQVLALRRVPWAPDNLPPDWPAVSPTVLLRSVSAFELRYRDARTQEWWSQWPGGEQRPGREALPEALEVRWASADQELPALTVRVRALVASDPSATGVVLGPPPR